MLHYIIIIINNNLLHLYTTSLGTQSALHSKAGISSSTTNVQHLPGWCNGSHVAPERTPHNSLLVERRQSDEANQCMWMIRKSWWSEANGEIWPGCRGYTPTLFRKERLLMTPESRDLALKSHLKEGAFLQYFAPITILTHTDHRVSTPCWPR